MRNGVSLRPMKKTHPTPSTEGIDLRDVQRRLGSWYDEHARALPWREDVSAYHVMLSEIILQQTRVDQGMAYYHRFTERFPTVQDLAAASEDEVLLLWQGLGYYSRGRNLLRAAQIIVSDFGGEIPHTPEGLSRLPGVGPYTRGAILSFAYNLPYPTVDGNVYRVLSRLFGSTEPIDTTRGARSYWDLAEALLDKEHPSRHNQAVIELGALRCTPRRPHCDECPIAMHCLAHRAGIEEQLPIKQGKTKVLPRHMDYFLIRLPHTSGGEGLLIRRRGAGDIWQGLYEFPLIETGETGVTVEELTKLPAFGDLIATLERPTFHSTPIAQCSHKLSHRAIYARLFLIEAEGLSAELPYQHIPSTERSSYAFPVLIERLLEQVS